jgi:hypothetical protein
VLAEGRDREGLDRLRDEGDDRVADGDDRRGLRTDEAGDELGRTQRDTGGEQPGRGGQRTAPAATRCVRAGRRGRGLLGGGTTGLRDQPPYGFTDPVTVP